MTLQRTVHVVAAAVALPLALSAQPPPSGQPGTQWTDEQLLKAVAPARAGRKLTPNVWPNGARVAVSIQEADRRKGN